jgi:hypothetical protein
MTNRSMPAERSRRSVRLASGRSGSFFRIAPAGEYRLSALAQGDLDKAGEL